MYYTLDTHDIQYIYNTTNEHWLGNKDGILLYDSYISINCFQTPVGLWWVQRSKHSFTKTVQTVFQR